MNRKIEIYSAGCGVCQDFLARVTALACSSCEISVHDTQVASIAAKAKELGVRFLPALVVNGELLIPDLGGVYSDDQLRKSGIGVVLQQQQA